MNAQTKHFAGEYYLQGVMETASGFKLNDDSTFEFFFSYGALDRYGSGTWSIKNEKIIFNSKPKPGNDFKLVSTSRDEHDFITINFPGLNQQYTSYFYCLINTADGTSVLKADSHGDIAIADKAIDSIQLVFEFCPEKVSGFAIDARKNNVYSFSVEQWMMEYFFKDFGLQIKDDHLEGRHPLLTKDNCIFTKN